MLHCAMRLPATRKTAAEEDRGEDNKDPDWLIEQSIARQVAGGVLHCATLKKSTQSLLQSLRKPQVLLSATLAATRTLRGKLLSRYVTLGHFWCNLRRNNIARHVARQHCLV